MEIKNEHLNSIPGPKSLELIKRRDICMSRSVQSSLYSICMKRGKGNYIQDLDDNWYLDLMSGAAVANLGYGRKDLLDAYTNVASNLQHTCFPYTPTTDGIELAENLMDITPGNFTKKVGFGLSGSDAIDAAIRMARKYTGKKYIIAFYDSYHGSIGCAAQCTDFIKLVDDKWRDPYTYHMHLPRTDAEVGSFISTLIHFNHEYDIAGVVIEPIQGDGGIISPPAYFFKELQELLYRYGIPLIVDEIQSGMGRTGKWWAIEHYNVVPDLLVLGKSITAGYAPLSAVVGRKEIVDTLDKVQYLFTYSAHPPSCAVANKVIEIIRDEYVIENAELQGDVFSTLLRSITDIEGVKEIRGKGLMMGIEFENEMGKVVGTRCTERGIYPGFVGKHSETLRIEPPLTFTWDETKKAAHKIKQTIDEIHDMPAHVYEKVHKYSMGLAARK